MRLIDEHKAEEKFQLNAVYTGREILDKLRTCATIDAVPMVRGHWAWVKDRWECSRCRGKRFHDLSLGLDAAYCGRCGAKMDKEEERG